MKTITISRQFFFLFIIALLLFPTISEAQNGNPFGYSVAPDTTSASTASVGSPTGQFEVSPMGAATYSVAIETPVGLPGAQPQIGIAYNSQAGNGIAGFGCNISGISAITRSIRNVYYDDVAHVIGYTINDAFYLDGQRLMRLSLTETGDSAIYCLESDPYLRVVAKGVTSQNGSGLWFYLITRDGIRHEYGTTDASARSANNNNRQYADTWYLTRSVWPTGNYIDYGYTKDHLFVYPYYVQYGQNLSVSNPLVNRIDFTYENRNDVQYFRVHGNEGYMQKRLKEITSKTGDSIYRRYSLIYDSNSDGSMTKFSRLVSINESNGRNESVKPINLSWQHMQGYSPLIQTIGFDITQSESQSTTIQGGDSQLFSTDINGDGITDIIHKAHVIYHQGGDHYHTALYTYRSQIDEYGNISYVGPGYTFLPENMIIEDWTYWTDGPIVCDFNGDGIHDLFVPFVAQGNPTYMRMFYLENFRSYNIGTPPSLNYYVQASGNDIPLYTSCDFDKDGKSDIVVLETGLHNNGYEMYIYKGCQNILNTEAVSIHISTQAKPKKIFTSDYNCDGLYDIMVVHESGYRIFFNQGGGINSTMFDAGTDIQNEYFANAYRMYEGDFNGDGLSDYLITREGSVIWSSFLGVGDGTFNQGNGCYLPYAYKKTGVGEDGGRYFTCLVYDMDGDGKSDVFISKADYSLSNVFQQVHTYWLQSDGSSFTTKNHLTSNNKDDASVCYYMLGDFNGDGLAEPANYGFNCYYGGNRDNLTRKYPHNSFSPNSGKLKTVVDGYDKRVDITYGTLTNPQIYEEGNESTSTIIDCTLPIHAVTQVIENSGTVLADTLEYTYGRLKYNMTGKGLLGFMKFKQTNKTLSMEYSKETVIDTVSLTPKWTYESNRIGSEWSSTNTYYSHVKPHASLKSYYSYPDSLRLIDFDNNVFTTRYAYDMNREASLTEKMTVHNDGYKKFTYSNFVIRLGHYLPRDITTETQYNGQSVYSETTRFTYNTKRQITNKSERYNTNYTIVNSFSYDSFGNVLSNGKNSNGCTFPKNYEYDSTHRFVTLHKEMSDKKTYYTHDIWGNVLTATDKTRPSYPLATTYTYDGWNRVASELAPSGQLTTYTRGWKTDGSSFVVTQGTGLPWTKDCFDRFGRKISSQSISYLNLPLNETYEYGIQGEQKKHTRSIGEGYNNITILDNREYDARKRLIRVQRSDQPTVTYSYASNVSITTTGERSVEKRYNLWGDIIQVTDNAGTIVYQYGSHGNPIQVISGRDTVTIGYDAVGRRISLTDPNAGTTSYAYDGFDRVITETDAQGHVTNNTYNSKNLLTQTETDGITTTHTYGTSTNNRYQLLSSQRGICTVNYTYDNLGRISTEQRKVYVGDTLETHYTYNNIGQLTTKQYVGGPTISYSYDAYGYKDEVRANNTLISKPYYNLGLWTSTKCGNNLFRHSWNSTNGRLVELSLSGGNIIGSDNDIIYSYDDETGNINGREGMFSDTESFTYDALDRLTSVEYLGSESHTSYAPNGNITYKTGIGHYLYDDVKHHAVTLVENTDNYIKHNVQLAPFNAFGKIESLTESETGYTMNFIYGPDNERWKTILKKDNNIVRTTYFMGDCEKSVQGGHKRRLYYLDNGAVFVRQDNALDSIYFMFTDHLGSIVSVVDYVGNELFKASYDAWGNQIVNHNDIGFYRGYTGHEMLPEFGLINMNGRLYDPLLGRFLSPDNYVQMPLNSQSFNRYSYCLNNPLKYNDPDGEWFFASLLSGFIRGVFNVFEGGNILSPISYAFDNVINDFKVTIGLFKGDFEQIFSRFTWELPQTFLGYEYSQFRLVTEKIDHVEYFDGATYVINDNSHSNNGVTLGSFININDRESMPVDENGKFAPQKNPLYMHEYGHYLQSQEYGLGYLVSVGIPSLISATFSEKYSVPPFSSHAEKWFERSANRKAAEYFGEKYGVSWDTPYIYPFRSEKLKKIWGHLKYKDYFPF